MFNSRRNATARTLHTQAAKAAASKKRGQSIAVKLLNEQSKLRAFVERMNDRHE